MMHTSNIKRRKGFSLVEILVALSIFAVVSIGISGLMISSLQVRQGSQKTLNAQQIAFAAIEHHKDLWSVAKIYQITGTNPASNLIPDFQNASYTQNVGVDAANLTASYGCLDSNGTDRSGTDGSKLFCTLDNPALRRVTITVRDAQSRVTAQLTAEIGRPAAKGN